MCQTHCQFPVTAAGPRFTPGHVTHTDATALRWPGLSHRVDTVTGNQDLACEGRHPDPSRGEPAAQQCPVVVEFYF